jgi:threonylcarbamoyladenosine tRNA methylthiotransferase MtaB
MGRSYTASFFRDLMTRISTTLPQAFIGADVIAGFPGESDEEFNETLQLIEELPFTDLHVFPYSRRTGTRAAAMSGQVPAHIIKKRAELLRTGAAGKKAAFLQKQVGENLHVLVQGYDATSGLCNGISINYVHVTFPGRQEMINTEQVVKVTGVSEEHVTGRLMKTDFTPR